MGSFSFAKLSLVLSHTDNKCFKNILGPDGHLVK